MSKTKNSKSSKNNSIAVWVTLTCELGAAVEVMIAEDATFAKLKNYLIENDFISAAKPFQIKSFHGGDVYRESWTVASHMEINSPTNPFVIYPVPIQFNFDGGSAGSSASAKDRKKSSGKKGRTDTSTEQLEDQEISDDGNRDGNESRRANICSPAWRKSAAGSSSSTGVVVPQPPIEQLAGEEVTAGGDVDPEISLRMLTFAKSKIANVSNLEACACGKRIPKKPVHMQCSICGDFVACYKVSALCVPFPCWKRLLTVVCPQSEPKHSGRARAARAWCAAGPSAARALRKRRARRLAAARLPVGRRLRRRLPQRRLPQTWWRRLQGSLAAATAGGTAGATSGATTVLRRRSGSGKLLLRRPLLRWARRRAREDRLSAPLRGRVGTMWTVRHLRGPP